MADPALPADDDLVPCGGCGTPTPLAKLTAHEAIERVRTPRTGEPPQWALPTRSARLVDRSLRYSTYLVIRGLCPACLAKATAETADEMGRLQRVALAFGAVAVVAAVLTLAFPHLWVDLIRILSLQPAPQEPSGAMSVYTPPFAAAMPTAGS